MKDSNDLEITTEELDSCTLQMMIEVSEERVQREMRRVAKEISQDVTIPGFRKGKVPYDIIAQRYGEDTLREHAATDLAESVFQEGLERQEIMPYAPASFEEMELEPMRFVFTIPLPPEVDLGDYRSLRVEPTEVEVSEDEIDEALEQIRQEEAMLKPVEDRGAQIGDVVALSVEGRSEDGEILLDEPEIELLLDPEEDGPAPGFHEELVGMESGDERVFKLEMLDDSPVDVVEFSVSVHGVFERILPGLDDDLARAVGKFDTLDELREEISERIRQREQAEADEEYAVEALDALVEEATIRYPEEAVEEMVDELIEAEAENIRRQHHLSFEDYLMVLGKTEDELREDLLPVAEARLERSLVLSELIQAEELAADEEELEERIVDISESLGIGAERVREQLSTEKGRQLVTENLLIEKAFSRLAAIARGEAEAEAEAEE